MLSKTSCLLLLFMSLTNCKQGDKKQVLDNDNTIQIASLGEVGIDSTLKNSAYALLKNYLYPALMKD